MPPALRFAQSLPNHQRGFERRRRCRVSCGRSLNTSRLRIKQY
ncbi:hypothetical protein [Nostoc sp. NMS7]|nr:hypothetical protein [Nostoc sp. NMS7]